MFGKIKDVEEFAFFNQQLAAMLKAGVPLEGALKRLIMDIKRGQLKDIFGQIHKRLTEGEAFSEIISDLKNKLPLLYYQLCVVGEKSGRLPSILTKLALYYRWRGMLRGKLQILMVYPLIVLVTAIAVSVFLSFLLINFSFEMFGSNTHPSFFAPHYFIIGSLVIIFLLYLAALYTPWLKFITDPLSWKLSASKYLQLANFSYMFEVLLDSEVPLSESLFLMKGLSDNRLTRKALNNIEKKAKEGTALVEAMKSEKIFPSTYTWILKNSGEQLPEGFKQNAEIYGLRAQRYLDIWIYAAMPIALVLVAVLVWVNFNMLFQSMISIMGMFY